MTKTNTEKTKTRKLLSVVSVLIGLGTLVAFLWADWNYTVGDSPEKRFVGRPSCIDCHQEQAELFHGSHHDLAMDLATDDTVLGKFDGTEIEHFGVTSRVFREGEKYMVHTEGPDGVMKDFQVKYVFGVEPLQQYMVELKPARRSTEGIGQVQVLRLSWDTTKETWFYLSPPDVKERIQPSDPLHWTGVTQRWNTSCAECHSTNLKKNFDPVTRTFATTFSEIDVSCEACHGPGSLHVELANRKGFFWDRQHGYGLAKLKTEKNIAQVETCAPCHSRRTTIADGFRPGCNFDDYYATQLITPPVYHADGQIRDEDYVYGSFIQSKMYHQNIRCSDCHDPHSAKLKFTGNMVCTSCHQHSAGKYDSINHHHHQPGTPGAQCVECHMPATTYMGVDSRRDHSFRVPRPDLSLSLGTPNACTSCHLEKSRLGKESQASIEQYLHWIEESEKGNDEVTAELLRVNQLMSDAFEAWYPETASPLRTKYYERLATGISILGNPETEDMNSEGEGRLATLISLAKDQSVPAMIRASALGATADGLFEGTLSVALESLNDADVSVIAAAFPVLNNELQKIGSRAMYAETPEWDSYRPVVEPVANLLEHPALRVRIEAARLLVSLPDEVRQRCMTANQRRAFDLGVDEYRRSMLVEADRAVSQLMLGGLYELLGDASRAKESYRTAIAMEPNMAGPRASLAAMLDFEGQRLQQSITQNRQGATVSQIQSTVERLKTMGEQIERLRREDYELLKVDIQRSEGIANTHSLHYRFGLASFLQRDLETAEKHILIALRQQPENTDYLLVVATFYNDTEQPRRAAEYVERLLELDPDHPAYRNLAVEVQSKLQNQ